MAALIAEPAVETEVCLGPVEHIPFGEGRTFMAGGGSVAVFRLRSGSLYATQTHCPHAGGPLSEGIVGGSTVICPLHSYKFNLATGACLNDTAYGLQTYSVRQHDGLIYLSVGRSAGGEEL